MMKENLARLLADPPFIPHPVLKGPHSQTIAAYLLQRSAHISARLAEPRIFDIGPGVRVLAHCSWNQDRASRPTLLLVHGLEGSAESSYMIGTADKALAAGFNAIRLNLRSCGGSADLTNEIYHAGLTEDLRTILEELRERDRLTQLYLVGFSLGGNIALKLAGELGREAPNALRGVAAISPSIHLASCADAIEEPSNLIYHLSFLLNLRRSMRLKARLYPDRYDASRLRGVWSIRKFDSVYTAPHAGFRDVADYYDRASAFPYLKRISIPSLIIQSKDDPFIPFHPFLQPEVSANPNVVLLAPERGGHVGFISAEHKGDDRFWAERKIVKFVSALHLRS
jgi:predicted alpha/beta-fold hydrolase